MKKLIILMFVSSLMYSQVSFNKSMSFKEIDNAVQVEQTMGIDFDMNNEMSIGFDTGVGMLVKANIPGGLNFRLGYDSSGNGVGSTIGFGYNWWSSGELIKTSIGTILDYSTSGTGTDFSTIRINLGWGF